MPSKSDMRRSTDSSTQSPRRPPKADSTASFPTPTSSSNSSQRDGSANRSNGKRGSSTNNHRGTNKSQNYSDNTRITSRNLFSYLESLQRETLLSLYGKSGNDPTTTDTMTIDPRCRYFARTILQRLPEMGRQFAIRLALCGGSFPSNLVECWCRGKAGRREMERSLRRMEILCVIEPTVDVESGTDGVDNESTNGIEGGDNGKAAKPKIVSLTSEFRTSLKTSLTSLRASPWDEVTGEQMAELQKRSSGDGSASNRTAPPTPVELEEFTRRRWNGVLHFLAGSDDDGAEDPPQAVVGFLEQVSDAFAELWGNYGRVFESGKKSDSLLFSVKRKRTII